MTGIGVIAILIALLFGTSFIRVGAQNLVTADNMEMEVKKGNEDFTETDGILSTNEMVDRGKCVITFTANEKEYNVNLEVYAPNYQPGDSVKVYYETANPSNASAPELFIDFYTRTGKSVLKVGIIICAGFTALGMLFILLGKSLRKKASLG